LPFIVLDCALEGGLQRHYHHHHHPLLPVKEVRYLVSLKPKTSYSRPYIDFADLALILLLDTYEILE
jgi:hypothetical protein